MTRGVRRALPLLVLALVLLAWLTLGGGVEVVSDAVAKVINGQRVGPATTVGDDGLVVGDPAALAAEAGYDLQVYALARAMQSEHGQDPDAYVAAVGWAIRNKAAERGVSIFKLLTDGAGTAGDGRFGRQDARAGTKYASTQQDPAERHIRIAQEVVGGAIDPTGGATHFFSPKAQNALAARAETDPSLSKYKGRDAVYILNAWTLPGGLYPEGAHIVGVSGVDNYRLTLFARGAAQVVS